MSSKFERTLDTDIDVRPLLRSHYPEKECVLMEEVSNAAGFGRNRSADFIVMNLWPSRGLSLTGIELKRSRNDWLRELKDPAKAEDIAKYCDHFYLLTTSETMAMMHEIPANWGWYAVIKKRLVVMKPAPKLTPIVMDRSFLACLLRRANDKSGFIHRSEIEDRVEQARQSGKDESKRHIESVNREHDSLRKQVTEFEAHAGITIAKRWDTKPDQLGKAIKWYMGGGVGDVKKELVRVQTMINALKTSTDEIMALDVVREHTPGDGEKVVKHLLGHEFRDVKLIGSLAKGQSSQHDIDILMPNDTRDHETVTRLIAALYDSQHGINIEHTDLGGLYMHGTIFGDVDIFFTTKDFDR